MKAGRFFFAVAVLSVLSATAVAGGHRVVKGTQGGDELDYDQAAGGRDRWCAGAGATGDRSTAGPATGPRSRRGGNDAVCTRCDGEGPSWAGTPGQRHPDGGDGNDYRNGVGGDGRDKDGRSSAATAATLSYSAGATLSWLPEVALPRVMTWQSDEPSR